VDVPGGIGRSVYKIEVCTAGSKLSGPGICIDGIPEIADVFLQGFWFIFIGDFPYHSRFSG